MSEQLNEQPPVFEESMGGALIDSARISVAAAMQILPETTTPVVVLPGETAELPTVHDCLGQAMQWLDVARSLTVQASAEPPTSLHVVERSVRS